MAKKHAPSARPAGKARVTHNGSKSAANDPAAAAFRRTAWTCGIVIATVVALVTAASVARQNSTGEQQDAPVKPPVAAVAKQIDESDVPALPAEIEYVAQRQPGTKNSDPIPPRNPLSGDRAYQYLKDICAIGRRISGTEGMKRQQELLKKHFEGLGGKVAMQEFEGTDPLSREKVPMANMIVTWHPDRKERLLLCAHYDTRPFPDRDPIEARRKGLFIGANDGASGTAVMMELAHLMPKLDSRYGVDFVLFDGEELVYLPDINKDDVGKYFLGSEHFAQEYLRQPPEHKYKWGVLLDMVGDADLQIYQERNSLSWRETRPLVAEIWGLAQRMNVREFVSQAGYEIRDDHLALRNIAHIPTCDVIDFDYPEKWHTEADVPENCSGESLAKVGWVMYEWFQRAR